MPIREQLDITVRNDGRSMRLNGDGEDTPHGLKPTLPSFDFNQILLPWT
jgi:hypothetical protein